MGLENLICDRREGHSPVLDSRRPANGQSQEAPGELSRLPLIKVIGIIKLTTRGKKEFMITKHNRLGHEDETAFDWNNPNLLQRGRQ